MGVDVRARRSSRSMKENVLEERRQGVSGLETVEELFTKMREEFGEFDEESRKVDELGCWNKEDGHATSMSKFSKKYRGEADTREDPS